MPTKRCSANGVTNEFIVVDDDEVIILDFPKTSKSKASGTSGTGNESILQRVISIDDDDDDDDGVTENVHKAGSSSRRNSRGANLQTSAEVDNDDCQFIHEKSAAFRFSKCRQTFSTMTSSGIRFGLGSESDSDFSDSDCSDCEIFEGSHREVRELWEKASLKKMKKAGKAGLSEEPGPSNLHCDTNFGPGFEFRTEQHDQTSFFFPARNPDGGKEASSTFFGTEKSGKAGPSEKSGPSDLHHDTNSRPGFEFRTEQHDQTSSFFTARNPDGGKETSSFSFGTYSRKPNTSLFGSEMEEDNRAKNCANSSSFSKPSKEPIHQNSFEEVAEQPSTVQVQCETPKLPKENQMKKAPKVNQKKKAADQSYTKEVVEEEDASKSSPPQTSDGVDSIPSTSGQVQGTAPAVDIMLSREMLKETDEYKKAQEEEWESRQQQLQLQAEEAQRERKRRKLANTRKLEMERRQKERVDEVRETQKKDEESMNMKEQIRAEITKSLKLLELKSYNMASLLRGLGIPVGGGASPLPQEVHAAYKRAVLKFHPDRASGGDLKQQVEAEEKFKLIARMKDKFIS